MSVGAKRADAVWYPESDEMGEHELQRYIAELLRPLLARWLSEQGRVAHAGADQFFYWVEGDPTTSRAPDVYVIDGVAQDIPEVGSWKTWEGHVPAFALEVCGDDWQKDYDVAPADYDAIGTKELVVFDPGATSRRRRRVRWQVFRRRRGKLVRVATETGDRVHVATLGCFLRMVTERDRLRLRLATGTRGDDLVPTEAEAERRRAEAERQRAEVERQRADALAARLAEVEAQLARLRGERG